MKPLKLEMTAFGPYKNTAVIDFEKLDSGVYAITGPTGAGKTTIFDAIMYALFGEVSGSGSKDADSNSYRTEKMIRSRFADPKTDTLVKLIFEEKSVKYTVSRKIHPTPSNPNPTPAVELEGGGKSVSKQGQVNEAIKTILGGMDAVKFRQIVMLAQGQFKAFMESKDDKRGEILREIFNADMYLDMQNALSAIQKKIDGKKTELNIKLADKLRSDVFILPDDISDIDRDKYSADLPSEILEKNLSELIECDKVTENQFRACIKKQEDSINALNEKKGKSRETNEQIKKLEETRKHKNELDGKADAMKKLDDEVQETEKALHVVSESYNNFVKAKNDKKKSEDDLKKYHEELADSETKLKKADERNKETDNLQKIIDEAVNKQKDYKDNIRKFSELKEAILKKQNAEDLYNTSEKKLNDEKAENDKRKGNLESAKKEYSSLENADAESVQKENDYKIINTKYELFDGKEGIESGFNDICRAEKSLEKLKQKLKTAGENALVSGEHFSEVSRKYYEGYAGKLGVKLEDELTENGTAECPVCKSRFCSGDEHHFADVSDDIPTDEELKKAEDDNNEKKRLFDEIIIEHGNAETALNVHRTAFICKLSDKLGLSRSTEWNQETISGFIKTEKKKAEDELKKAKSEWDEAKKKTETKTNLKSAVEKFEMQIIESDKKIQSYNDSIISAKKDKEHHSADINRLNDEIQKAGMSDFPNETAVKNAICELEKKISEKNMAIKEIKDNYDSVKQEKANLEGKAAAKEKQLKELQEQIVNTEKTYADKLSEAKFTDEAAFLNARNRAGSNPEQWLSDRNNEIRGYNEDVKNTEEKIKELSAKKLEYVDLDELENQITELKDKKDKETAKCNLIEKQRQSHEAALRVLQENEKSRKKIETAYKRITVFSEAASGGRAEGGSHTFEGFVLGRTFREMLDISSKYFYDMTGGKYQFINEGSVRKGSEANYQISVQDSLSGSMREIGSLSGGESFQAAMALALGLSETVQSHNSSVNIDTMFIDEGFGSLDKDSLQRMLKVLSSISGGSRQIGIISHVDELKETITAEKKSVRVRQSRDREGSTLVIE